MSAETRTNDIAAIGVLDEPIRRRLYDWVVGQPDAVGRDAAAKALGITRALATFHLEKLVAAGLLDGGYRRLSGRVGPGAGRPARIYSPSRREVSVSLPERRYDRVSSLFATALERLGDGGPPAALRTAARKLGTDLGSVARRGSGRMRLMRALERGGYQPLVGKDGTIRLRNCPYDALVEDHRDLVCGTNLAIAQGIGRGAGAADLRPVLDPQPGFCCVAYIQRR